MSCAFTFAIYGGYGETVRPFAADPSIVAAIGEVLKKSRSPMSVRYYTDLEVAIEHLRSLAAGREYTLPRLLTSPNAP